MKTFGSLLKFHRNRRHLSQSKLAMLCNPEISQIYIAKLECGDKIAPPEKTVIVLAKALNLSDDETQTLLGATRLERVSVTIQKTRWLGTDFIVRSLLKNFNRDELLNITSQIKEELELAPSAK